MSEGGDADDYRDYMRHRGRAGGREEVWKGEAVTHIPPWNLMAEEILEKETSIYYY